MKKLHLSYDLSFEELYTLDGLKKLDSLFIEKLLRISPDLCNKMLDARTHHNKLYKLDESKLILELAPHLESFISELFSIQNSVENYKDEDKKLDIIYQCNKSFIQKHVMNLDKNMSEIIANINTTKTSLMMYGVVLPSDPHNVLEAEIDMSTTFLEIYEQSNSEDEEWATYHREILTHVENYSLWAVKSFEGRKFHMNGALFRVAMKLDYNNLIPDLKNFSNFSQQSITVTKNGEMLAWILFAANFKIPTTLERWSFNNKKTILHSKQRGILKIAYTSTIMNFPESFVCTYNNIDYQKNFLFRILNHPEKSDVNNIISERYTYLSLDPDHLRTRSGFGLNDIQTTSVQASHEANYCLYCHNRSKDSCSHGMKQTDGYQENPLKVKLQGCPLEQKISEMHLLRSNRNVIGALATIMIDNPMVAATGHRICNDCMKGCIFQKQTPVNTPSVESKILKDVLYFPFGFEIYSLLSRWNPLNFINSLPKAPNNHKALVVGLGPAGFTLIHYLLNAGVNVVGVDGLKIEPLISKFTGISNDGSRCSFEPIDNIQNLFEKLESRTPKGFGGVMEYGITVRWDKNMLDIIRLLLLRRKNFRMYDGVRFGSNLTYNDCREFNHLAFSVGAGSPNIPDIKNVLTKGVRMSSDFLMSLQAGGAHRSKVILPLEIRMPIVVIGAGLTAVDSATEAIQYYLVQIRKFLNQYELLGEKFIASLNKEDKITAREFISHARQLKKNPKKSNQLIEKWGGVTILYRKTLQDSPAYRINHEELAAAFEEGIKFVENAVPNEILDDEFGHCKGVVCTINGKNTFIHAKSVIVATGTKPNTFLSKEDHRLINNPKVSYFGDADPKYNGSVVKAMASAKNGYKKILEQLKNSKTNNVDIFKKFDALLTCKVKEVVRLTPNVIEVIVKAPLAAAHFEPGQFFRLQKYESNTSAIKGYKFPMEGLALTGAAVKGDYVSLVVLELGLSSKLCNLLKPNEKVVLMGPTGMPTSIPHKKTVLLIGGGLGNAVLISIGKKMREQGCRVLYFAGYKKLSDRFKVQEIEEAADTVIWCCDEGLFSGSRSSDVVFHGNIIEAIKSYPKDMEIQRSDIQKMIVIGSDSLMAAVAEMRKDTKMPYPGIASVNSPMNCMMKEICAQCIQKHRVGDEDIYIYSCASQDQNIDTVDFKHLEKRLTQNSLLEKTADKFFTKIKHKN